MKYIERTINRLASKGAMHKRHKNRKSGRLGRKAYLRVLEARCHINLHLFDIFNRSVFHSNVTVVKSSVT